jgi:hypothetical protein
MKSVRIDKLSSSVHLDPMSMITTARVEVRVHRPVAELVSLIQPESWVRSKYFRRVYRVRRAENGAPVPSDNPHGEPFERDTSPSTPENWTALYYEHVQAGATLRGSVEFQNLLDIEFEQVEGRAELKFSLDQCLASRWGSLRRSGGLDVDRGYTRVERQHEDITYVDAMKSVRYTPFARSEFTTLQALGVSPHIVNHLAPAFLERWMEQLVLGGCGAALNAEYEARQI